ncbi:RusA family crossover junction endodeoxyribonuclease [Enterococcus sp. 5H]|uniref:RusA family crossover junction endodeoxyribonuclease n=1 Tax=Enterococcus sp. 5H TaxID=1229490 RepID=UPI002302C5DF|nr:RusA family crossover junction endodeoxyribonuclease [Enterococcus sp. 5H]
MKITIPIAPKPQARPRFNSFSKRAYEDSAMTAYKKSVKYHVMACKPSLIESGSLGVSITFYIYPPKKILSKKSAAQDLENETLYVDKKPDIDNYFKAVTDAAEGILYKNDGQIAVVTMQKLYSLNPRTEIEVEELK